ncbi:Peptidase family M13 [Aphelenchoides besseyi]|nr:Peptidase family M13 [Aphelenchoides besseyi]
MLLRYLLLLSWIPALGLTVCVDRVSDCERARPFCRDFKVGSTVRRNCSRMCGTCSNETSKTPRKPSKPSRKPSKNSRRKKCVDNKQCRHWKGFCKATIHTEATKQWLCPRMCFNCKAHKKPVRKPGTHKNPHSKPPTSPEKPQKSSQKPTQNPSQKPPQKIPQKPEPSKPKPQPSKPNSKPKDPKPEQKPPAKSKPNPAKPEEKPRPMTAASQQFKESIDESAPVCDDFYQFTCGKYIKTHPIKSPDDNMNLFRTTKSDVRKRQVELILDNSPTTSQAVKTMRNYRDICINGPSAKSETANLWNEIQAIGFAPIFKDGWKRPPGRAGVTNTLLQMAKFSSRHYFFDLSVKKISPSEVKLLFLPVPLLYKNPTKYGDPKYANEIAAIETYIKEVLTILLDDVGVKRPNLDADIKKIVKYDSDRAKVYLINGFTDRETMAANAEKKKFSAFKDAFFIDWDDYIQKDDMIDPEVKKYLATDPEIYVYTENFFRVTLQDIGKTMADDFYNYYVIRYILDSVQYLDSRFDAPYHKFIQAVGEEDRSAQSKATDECVNDAIAQFPLVNDFLYNSKYLKEDELQALQNIDTRKAIVELINDNKYLDGESKAKAVTKVNAMTEILGGLQQARDEKLLDQEYAGIVIDSKDTYRKMVVKVTAENKRKKLKMITTPGAATEFVEFRSTDIDMHQIYFENKFYIPAAIIQPPYHTKTPDHPAVLNFGYFAYLRARQIMHSLDPTGVQFDKDGNRGYWMTAVGQKLYGDQVFSLGLVYTTQTEEQSKRNLNSKQTLASDIVDHAAIRAVFRAYQNYRKANPKVNVTVPGFDQYSPEQQLFISFGTMMCASQGDKYLDRFVLDKNRSPTKNVVNTVVAHYDEFAKAFKCPENSKMNPKPKVEVWN